MIKTAKALSIRTARLGDRNELRSMQRIAMSILGAGYYTPAEIEGFITHIGTMDDFLLHEGTYYVAIHAGAIVGSGGWSRLRPNYANATGPAGHVAADRIVPKVRSVFVHPAFARRGIATRIMEIAEREAAGAGYPAIELTATLSGVPLYAKRGYVETKRLVLALPDELGFGAVAMRKELDRAALSATA